MFEAQQSRRRLTLAAGCCRAWTKTDSETYAERSIDKLRQTLSSVLKSNQERIAFVQDIELVQDVDEYFAGRAPTYAWATNLETASHFLFSTSSEAT